MKPFTYNYYILLYLCFSSYITTFPYINIQIDRLDQTRLDQIRLDRQIDRQVDRQIDIDIQRYVIQSEIEIQVLDKGLDFALILNPSYEKILKILKFRDQPSEDLSDKPTFCRRSNWKSLPGHPGLKLFQVNLKKKSLMTLMILYLYHITCQRNSGKN